MKTRNYSSNRIQLKEFREKLRNESTSSEAALWNLLKNKQLDGKKFRRQHSLGNYIVDFYCSSDKLIIELDGDSHGGYAKIQLDEVRDKFLQSIGCKVIRFENKFVFQDPEYVLEIIRNNLL
jgi:very-short-patch-repair endonuclease